MPTKRENDVEYFDYPVEVELTDKEVIASADEYAAADAEETEAELRFESLKKKHKTDLEGIQIRKNELLIKIRTKKETRQMMCYNEPDFFEGIMEVRRKDNGALVTTRKMTADEYREKLPFEKDGEQAPESSEASTGTQVPQLAAGPDED
jgi:hypothetical protein